VKTQKSKDIIDNFNNEIDVLTAQVLSMGEMWDDLLCQRIANETNKDNFFQQIKRAKENISFLKKTIDTDKRRFKKEEKTQ
jgi:hypothetical protein